MVYESDFYTTRRPYRASPAYSSYTTSFEPSRQVRILPGLGKVHIVHSYDRIVPYVGHKRLTVVTSQPRFSTRSSVLNREYDWIERRVRPRVGYSAVNRYLNSDSAVRIYYTSYPITSSYCSTLSLPSTTYYPKIYRWYYDWPSTDSTYSSWRNSYYWPRSYNLPSSYYWPYYRSYLSSFFRNYYLTSLPSLYYKSLDYQFNELENKINNLSIFDTETSLIRAQTSALLKRVHDPVPRAQRFIWPTVSHYRDNYEPSYYGSSNSVQRILTSSPSSKSSYTTYYTAPERKYIGTGRLSSVSYAGGRAYDRRPHIYLYDNPMQSDIQLLSYYINKFKQEKTYSADSSKASANLSLSPARPTRKFGSKRATEDDVKQDEEMQKLREARAARLAFINEEEKFERHSASREVDVAVKAKKEKEDAARLAEERALAEEQARQQGLAKEAARKAELARQEELAAQAAAQKAADLAELAKKEEAKKQAEIDKKKKEDAEEKARLEEQKRLDEAKAEETLQAQLRLEEIARKAEEEREDELARQAEELAELARQEAQLAEQAKHEAEEEEQKRQEAELEDLRRQEAELAELERQEQELAEVAEKAEAARLEAEQQQAELEELEKAQAELDALEEGMESDLGPAPTQEAVIEEVVVDEAELARQAELEELRRQEEELEELEKAQAELDALEEEAKAMASDFGPPVDHNDEEEDDEAIAEGAQSDED